MTIKKFIYRFLLLLMMVGSFSLLSSTKDPVTLSLARLADGIFIGPDEINNMCILGQSIYKILDSVTVNNKTWTFEELILAETNNKLSRSFASTLLNNLTDQFLAVSSKCLEAANASKKQFFPLINQWCHQRNPESQLLEWAYLAEKEEGSHFRKTVTTLKKFYEFCSDLKLFLNDVIHNCPKAYQLFKNRMEKLQTIHDIALSELHISSEEAKLFIGHIIHQSHIDSITIVSVDLVRNLWHEFKKTTR